MKIAAIGSAVSGLLVALMVFFRMWYTVDQGELAVVLRNGAVSSVEGPGLHFKLPFVDKVVEISTRTEKLTFAKMEAYSNDQQPAFVKVSVNFRTDPGKVSLLYAQFGANYADAVMQPVVPKAFKIAFGQSNAIQAVTQRAALNVAAEKAIAEAVTDLSGGKIIVESVNVEDIKFSAEYEKSIEQRMLAEVEVSRLRQNAEREKVQGDIVVTQANAKANALRAEAQAAADAVRLSAAAEAFRIEQTGAAQSKAIKARGDALAANPGLVNLVQAERWDGKLPATMVPGSALPMVNIR